MSNPESGKIKSSKTKTESVESKKNSLKSKIVAVAVLAIICLGALSYTCFYLLNKTVALELQIVETKKQTTECLKVNADKQIALEKATAELLKSKERIAGIKNQDDLLKRDIELYITARYRKIPKSVAKTIAATTVDMAKKEDLAAELLVGIMQVESGFNPTITGPKTKYGHARGLMQIMPEWAPKFNLKSKFDFHDIDINIASGIKVFKIHLEEGKGKISEGLYLYVNKDRAYVDKVYNAMGKFVSFRATVDDDDKTENDEEEKEMGAKDVKPKLRATKGS